MNKTTTLVAPNDVPAGGFEVGEGSGGGHGNGGGDGGKDGFFTEKENTQLEDEDTQMENSDEENGDDDLELEERLPSLGDGFYEIEAIRRKRYRKGKLEYFVKWLGWGEHANTWEPPDNLVGVPEIIEAFEKGCKTPKQPKQQKRKRKHAGPQTQVKKRVERSATPYSLRCLKTSTANNNHAQAAANNHSAPASLSEQLPYIPNTPAFPQTVLFADEVENNGEGSSLTKENHANDNKTANPPEEVPQNNEEKEYDPKLSELKATTSNGIDADKPEDATTNGNGAGNLAMQFQEAMVPPGETGMNDQPMVVSTEGNVVSTEGNEVSTEPVQSGSGRPRGRPRKSLAKKFKIDSCADKPGNTQIPNSAPVDTAELAQTGVTDNATASSNTATESVKPAGDIVKIIKPVGYTPAAASTTQDVLVTFEAIRSDGSEVVVDNNHLKTYHPILLIDYYEQHLRYNPKAM